MKKNKVYLNISTSSIFKIAIIILGLFFLYFVRDIVIITIVAVVAAAAISGPVNWLQKRKVPRVLGVTFIYLVMILLLSIVFYLILPLLTEQIKNLAGHFPFLMEQIGQYKIGSGLESILGQISARLGQTTSSIFATIIDLFGGIFSAIVVLVISFYLTVQENGVKNFILSLTPKHYISYASELVDRIQIKIGGWLRGQLLLMLIIGCLTYIGLLILGVNYALLLALLAGFLEIIPYLGPIFSAIPAIILAFIQSPFLAFLVLILYIVIQQLENYVVVPQVMKRTVGLNPITIIIVMLIGAKLAGILGIILSVPLAASAGEILKDFKR